MYVHMTGDLKVSHGTNPFAICPNACWIESVKPLQFFYYCLPVSFVVHQCRLSYCTTISCSWCTASQQTCCKQRWTLSAINLERN